MYCPKCAAPINNVKFCRSCGTNVSLIPQALSGELPVDVVGEGEGRSREGGLKREINVEKAATEFSMGVGFILAAFLVTFYVPSGVFWGWSLLIPAFACIGSVIGQYLQFKERNSRRQFNHAPSPPEITAPTTSELDLPPSVTEQTTKHLDK